MSQTEYASLKNTVGFRITENNLYQIIFISSEPFHKIIAMSMLEICSYDCCRGQKDVLLSATRLWTSNGFGLEESQNPWPSLSHLQEHVREVRGSSLSLGKSTLFLGGYQQTQAFLWLLVRGSCNMTLASPGESLCQTQTVRRVRCMGKEVEGAVQALLPLGTIYFEWQV